MIVVALGLAFLTGAATAAWIQRDHTRALVAELAQTHTDLQHANQRTQHARAENEWGSRWQ